jgi:hypothetical protein
MKVWREAYNIGLGNNFIGRTTQQKKKRINNNNLSKNGQRTWIDIFKRWHTNGQKKYGKMLSITNYEEMQIKITMRYHLTHFIMDLSKIWKMTLASTGRKENSGALLGEM